MRGSLITKYLLNVRRQNRHIFLEIPSQKLNTTPACNLLISKVPSPGYHLHVTTSRLTPQCCPSLKANNINTVWNKCHFHTTKPTQALPGIFYFIIKPVLRVGAIIFARFSRKWWSKLTPEEKMKIYAKIKERQSNILGWSMSAVGLAYVYYFLNQETCPITGRQKFIIVRSNQLNDIVSITYDALIEQHSKNIVPTNHWAYQRVAHVVRVLLAANKDLMEPDKKKMNYAITIIDDPTCNAFVLPDGRIFIFTGMLKMCPTDNELATVLAHELSHTLLNHVAEKISNKTFLEILFIVPLVLVWFLLPDLGAFVTQLLLDDLKSVLFELPFDRDMETEADEVGLKLMARACYDVRVASLFWEKMHLIEKKQQGGPEVQEFLSTHPSHETRYQHLASKMDEAIAIRKECNCLPLGPLVSNKPFLLQRLFRSG